jgi:LysM repeat protein
MIKALIILVLCIAIFGTGAFFAYEIFVKPKKLMEQEVAEGPPAPPPDPSLPELGKAMKIKSEGKLDEARAALEGFIENYPFSSWLDEAKNALGEINSTLFFSKDPSPDKEQYVVKSGDALAKIERRLKTTSELIMRSNNLDDPTKLQIGQVLIVPKTDFSIKILRKENKVVLFNKGRFFKQYHAKSAQLPAAKNPAPLTGKVTNKIAWKDGKRVAFGTKDFIGSARTVAFSIPGYTLSTDPEEGGEKASSGLVLSAADMEEISVLVNKGTPVIVE